MNSRRLANARSLSLSSACIAATLLGSGANAAPKDGSSLSTRVQIDRTCDALTAFAKTNPHSAQTFWDVTAGLIPPAGEGLWWRLDNVEQWAVTDFLGAHGPNSQMTIWRTPEGATLVSAFFTSDSGDWAYFVDYCYRPGGTLARTTSTLNSFVAANLPNGIQRERARYYSRRGLVIATRSSVSDLATAKPLRIRVEGYDEPDYGSLEQLPFFPLLAATAAVPCWLTREQ